MSGLLSFFLLSPLIVDWFMIYMIKVPPLNLQVYFGNIVVSFFFFSEVIIFSSVNVLLNSKLAPNGLSLPSYILPELKSTTSDQVADRGVLIQGR
jgi:hypothetical protein